MKEVNSDVELRKEDGQKKRHYEKPQINAVRFFADRVLGEFCFLNPGSGCNNGVDQ